MRFPLIMLLLTTSALADVEWACLLPGAPVEARGATHPCPVVYEVVAHFLESAPAPTTASRDCQGNFAPLTATLNSHTRAALNLGNRIIAFESEACDAAISVQIVGEFPRKHYVRRGFLFEGHTFPSTDHLVAIGRKQSDSVSFFETDDADRTPFIRIKNTGNTCVEVQGQPVRPGEESEKIVLENAKRANQADEAQGLNRISLKATSACLIKEKAAPIAESGPISATPSPSPADEKLNHPTNASIRDSEPGVERLLNGL